MKAKILIFLTRFPYPAIDGTRHKILDDVIAGLATTFELTFLVVTDEPVSQEQTNYLESNYGKVILFTYPKWRVRLNALLGLLSKYPLQANYYYFQAVQAWFTKEIDTFDAVYVHTLRLGKYLELLDKKQQKKIMLDFNDAVSLNYAEARKKASFLWRVIYSIEMKRVVKYEKKLLDTLTYFNVVSEFDRTHLLQETQRQDIVFKSIPHGVNSSLFNTTYNPQKKQLVFMGNLSYPPNFDAMQHFLERVFPKIQEIDPDIHLCIIGKGNKLAKKVQKNVTFTGFVDDPTQIIATSSLFVAPLRFGAGMPTKILEAMALGMPVITTPLGARGITGLNHEENVFIQRIDDVTGWVNAITALLDNETLRRKVGYNARQLIQEHYSDKVAAQAFCNFFSEIITTT